VKVAVGVLVGVNVFVGVSVCVSEGVFVVIKVDVEGTTNVADRMVNTALVNNTSAINVNKTNTNLRWWAFWQNSISD
jgi:hypothetical protein